MGKDALLEGSEFYVSKRWPLVTRMFVLGPVSRSLELTIFGKASRFIELLVHFCTERLSGEIGWNIYTVQGLLVFENALEHFTCAVAACLDAQRNAEGIGNFAAASRTRCSTSRPYYAVCCEGAWPKNLFATSRPLSWIGLVTSVRRKSCHLVSRGVPASSTRRCRGDGED